VQAAGVRRLCALVAGLPPDSALGRAQGTWSDDLELQAVAIERAEFWNQQLVGMWAEKGAKLPPAISITHPDRRVPEPVSAPKKKATNDPAALARLFN
jgi:hypothetical protein